MPTISSRSLGLLAALAAAAALGIAWATEIWGGLVPCALCLLERWPYRLVIVLGLLASVTPLRLSRALLLLAILCLAGGAVAGAVHLGVENGWWPSPLPECAAPHISGASITQRLASMPARPSKPCDDPTYLIPRLPLSMAAMNLLYALAISALLAILLSDRSIRR